MICAAGPPAGPHLHLALALRLQRVLALRLHLVLARQLHLVLVLRLQLVLARRQPRPPLRDRAHESTRGLSRDRAETTETSRQLIGTAIIVGNYCEAKPRQGR